MCLSIEHIGGGRSSIGLCSVDRTLLEGRLQYDLPNFGLITEKVNEKMSLLFIYWVGWGVRNKVEYSEGNALEGFDEITNTAFSLGFLILF